MSKPMRFLAGLSVLIARLSITFWVGGAILFVITSVAEQRHAAFDSLIKDQLATIRFPLYYVFGWGCLGLAMASTLVGVVLQKACLRRRMIAAFLLTLLSTGIAIADYKWVYLPLQELITPPGQARTQQFISLHNRSCVINEVHLTIALLAAVLVCLPDRLTNAAGLPSCPE